MAGLQDGQEDGPKRAQDGPNMSPRQRKMHPIWPNKIASGWPKTARGASKTDVVHHCWTACCYASRVEATRLAVASG
eukprot:6599662-Pyramimonas_sp.AAC.1